MAQNPVTGHLEPVGLNGRRGARPAFVQYTNRGIEVLIVEPALAAGYSVDHFPPNRNEG